MYYVCIYLVDVSILIISDTLRLPVIYIIDIDIIDYNLFSLTS